MLVGAQETRFVTDNLKLEARSGPSTQHRVVRMLESGESVKVLEEKSGWSRIELSGGAELWMLTRYLQDDPVARTVVEEALSEREAAVKANDAAQKALDEVREASSTIEESRDAFAKKSQALAAELSDIKNAASQAIAIQKRNEGLVSENRRLEQLLSNTEREVAALRASRERDWFIAGAGVLVGGMILGFIIPKIRWRRRRSWDQL
ncbi:MAG: TIGR04211 family SH3 domain-containing protein [Pseudomonadota bacterium]